jgi:hypothetical protein
VLTDNDYQTARKYWKVLKGRLAEEGCTLFSNPQNDEVVSDTNQLKTEKEPVTNCYQLKLVAPDGKMRLTQSIFCGLFSLYRAKKPSHLKCGWQK